MKILVCEKVIRKFVGSKKFFIPKPRAKSLPMHACNLWFLGRQIVTLREDLRRMFRWLQVWQMLFNLEKCSVMHMGKRNQGYHMKWEARY